MNHITISHKGNFIRFEAKKYSIEIHENGEVYLVGVATYADLKYITEYAYIHLPSLS